MSQEQTKDRDFDLRLEKAMDKYLKLQKTVAPYVLRKRKYVQVSTADKWRSAETHSRELSTNIR